LKIIIVGLGNPSFLDDGIGLLVARAVKNEIVDEGICVVESSGSGLDILDIIADFEKAIIVDAVQTSEGQPGSIYRFDLDDTFFQKAGSPHTIDFLAAINLGRKSGLRLPREIIVYGIEAQTIDEPVEGCTGAVKASVPVCVEKIVNELSTEKAIRFI
jgi:hydrogenase maturation protease